MDGSDKGCAVLLLAALVLGACAVIAAPRIAEVVTGYGRAIEQAQVRRMDTETQDAHDKRALENRALAAQVKAREASVPAESARNGAVAVGAGIGAALLLVVCLPLAGMWAVNWVRTQSVVVSRRPTGETLLMGGQVVTTDMMSVSGPVLTLGSPPTPLDELNRVVRWAVTGKLPARPEQAPPQLVDVPEGRDRLYLAAQQSRDAVAQVVATFKGAKNEETQHARLRVAQHAQAAQLAQPPAQALPDTQVVMLQPGGCDYDAALESLAEAFGVQPKQLADGIIEGEYEPAVASVT